MLNQEIQEKIFNLFDNEIRFYEDENTREGMVLLLKALISYKLTTKTSFIFSHDSQDIPLRIHSLTPDYKVHEDHMFNCLLIGGQAINGTPNESICAFVNMQFDHSTTYEVIIDEERRIVQVTGNDDKYPIYLFYLLASIMPKLLHWYFKNEDLTKIEDIVRIFFKKDTALINKCFESLVIENNLLLEANKRILESLGESVVEMKERDLNDRLLGRRSDLDALYERIGALNQDIEKILSEQMILRFKKEEYENPLKEIVEFLEKTTEDVKLTEVSNDGYIVLEIITNLEEVQDEQYEDCIANARKSEYFSIQGKDGTRIEKEDLKLFYKKIFMDKELKLKAKTKIRIDLFNWRLTAMNVEPGINYIEHPHLRGSLGCFGTAGPTIAEYLTKMRYTEAISQVLYAASQSTLSDLTANRSLINALSNPESRPILLPNGEYANVEESIEYIKEHNEKTGE